MNDKLARVMPMESETEIAGVGTTSPSFRLLIAAVVVSLLVVGAVTVFLVLLRPMEEEATVEVPTEETPTDVPPVDEPTV